MKGDTNTGAVTNGVWVKEQDEKDKLIHELMEYRKMIREQEEFLGQGSFELDLLKGDHYVSEGLVRLYGVLPGELQPEEIFRRFFREAEQERILNFLHEVQQFRNTRSIVVQAVVNGQIRILELAARLYVNLNGVPERIIGMTRDLTEVEAYKNELNDQLIRVDMMNQQLSETKRKLESQLAELEKTNYELQQYKQTMLDKDEFLNQGTWEWDVQKDEMIFSRGIYRLFGYHHKDEMKQWDETGKDLSIHLDEEELKRSNDDWVKILQEADTYLREMEITTRDGFIRRLETFGKVFRDEAGEAYKVIGTTRDITKLKEYEQELEVKINELNRSNKDLEEFAYIASHDLHEPLRKLSTFGQRLSSNARGELSPANLDYLERMLKATENMRNLIDNLLEFSRVTRGSARIIKADLSQIVDEVISEQELRIEETGARVSYDSLPVLEVIPSQIKQLFNNLLNNAIKFIRPGEIPFIRFECSHLSPEERSRFKLKPNREYYRISVRDNGIGFDKAHSEKIFQIFQRLHGKSEYSGSGIGLAICRKIADNHKGLIFAESESGKGSVFTVILPNKP